MRTHITSLLAALALVGCACGGSTNPSVEPTPTGPTPPGPATETDPAVPQPAGGMNCSLPPGGRPVGMECRDGTTVEGWIAGMPVYEMGAESVGALYYYSESGPDAWPHKVLLTKMGKTIESSKIYKARVLKVDTRGVEDAEGEFDIQLLTILEERAGGPPVELAAGGHIAGYSLSDAAAAITASDLATVQADLAPIEVRQGELEISLEDVAAVKIGDIVLTRDNSVEEVAAALPNCQHQQVRGGTPYECDGARVLGQVGGAISITIRANP